MNICKIIVSSVLLFLISACLSFQTSTPPDILYVGTFKERNSQGIYVYEFQKDSLSFKLLQTLPEQKSPSFVELHPSGKFLYSVTRGNKADNQPFGAVCAFKVDESTGKLSFINQQSAYGKSPCHISLDNSGKFAFVSNYSSGSLVVYSVKDNGSLSDSIQHISFKGSSVNTNRQNSSHVHSSFISTDNKHLYVSDLGTDKVMIYRLQQQTGLLSPATTNCLNVIAGSGPRHLAMHPKINTVYIAEELTSTVSVAKRNLNSGELTVQQQLPTIPVNFKGESSVADIHTTPDGKFLYVSNRGHNSLAIYSIHPETGLLTFLDYTGVSGEHPRNFMITPDGKYLLVANRTTDNIVVFEIDKNTGLLDNSGLVQQTPGAVCLKMKKM